MQITPRVYQVAAVKAAIPALKARLKRALIVLATGLGKTLTAALVAKKMRAKKILFLVHNNFILQHAVEEFRVVFGNSTKMAVYNGMSKEGAEEAQILFATWQTMGKNLKQWDSNYFDLIIVDEAHHSGAATYLPVLKYFKAARLGITATPDRSDDLNIRTIFGKEVVNVTLEEAIARNWLPRIEYHVITDESLDEEALQRIASEIREGKKRFTMAEVNRRIFIRKRDEEIARIINSYDEKAVVFCANIKHAERLSQVLKNSATFHSSTGSHQEETWKKNQGVLADLKEGRVRRVCAVNAFNEGVDVPSVGLVSFCRVTSVSTIFRQQLGRGLRPGKDKLVVLDFVGNLERVQLVLDMMNRVADLHEQTTPRSEIAREGYIREQFEVSGKGFEFTFSDEVVDLMDVLKRVDRDLYPTWQEASKAAQRLKIATADKYRLSYRKDPQLPGNPAAKYGSDFPGWASFLGQEERRIFSTWKEARGRLTPGKFTTRREYKDGYKEMDSRLPMHPDRLYNDFPGWDTYLGKRSGPVYETWQQASKAAQKLGLVSSTQYLHGGYKKDARLPSDPSQKYSDFPNWREFLGRSLLYPTWEEASVAARQLGATSSSTYRHLCKSDHRLPTNPKVKYKDFPGWEVFLGREDRAQQ